MDLIAYYYATEKPWEDEATEKGAVSLYVYLKVGQTTEQPFEICIKERDTSKSPGTLHPIHTQHGFQIMPLLQSVIRFIYRNYMDVELYQTRIQYVAPDPP